MMPDAPLDFDCTLELKYGLHKELDWNLRQNIIAETARIIVDFFHKNDPELDRDHAVVLFRRMLTDIRDTALVTQRAFTLRVRTLPDARLLPGDTFTVKIQVNGELDDRWCYELVMIPKG